MERSGQGHGDIIFDEETEDVSLFTSGSIASLNVADTCEGVHTVEETKMEESLAEEVGGARVSQPTNQSGLHAELIQSKRIQDGPVPPELRLPGVPTKSPPNRSEQLAGSSGQSPYGSGAPNSVPVAIAEPCAEPYNDAAARVSGAVFAPHNSGGSPPPGSATPYAPSHGSGGSIPSATQNTGSSTPPAAVAIDGGQPTSGASNISSIPPATPPEDTEPTTNNNKRPYLIYGSIALLALVIIIVAVAVPVSISSKDEPLDEEETQRGAPTVCPEELARVEECANEALTPNELDACVKCLGDSIPNTTTTTTLCSPEVETGLCEGFRRCECGTCADEIEEYLYCYDRTEIGCNFACASSPSPTVNLLTPSAAPTAQVCPEELASVVECADAELPRNDIDACVNCLGDSLSNTTTLCSEVEAILCDGLRRCECGTCADEIEEYFRCIDRTKYGCNVACTSLPTPSPVAAPTSSPVNPPTPSPVAAPTSSPVSPPTIAPVSPPTSAPVSPPTSPPVSATLSPAPAS